MTSPNNELRYTPLYNEHKKLGAKLVPFGGWMMPVSYEGVLAEHKTVREACGLFDVSHMGEVRVTGSESREFLQSITINDVSKLQDGLGQYSAILNPQGGMIDDLIMYRLKENEFFVCINASNDEKDFRWILEQSKSWKDATVTHESPKWAQLAIQGPHSPKALKPILTSQDHSRLEQLPYTGIMACTIGDKPAYVARTGYTGEHGYEIYIDPAVAPKTWNLLLETAPATGIKPIGLGARDTLRLEACYLLYGNDMNDSVSPLEAGIGWATKLEKGPFIGREPLLKQKTAGLKRRIFAIKMEDDGIPRHGMMVYAGDVQIGEVTSGSVLPTLGGAGGMALLDPTRVKEGDTVFVDIRGKRKLARLMKRPLYSARVK